MYEQKKKAQKKQESIAKEKFSRMSHMIVNMLVMIITEEVLTKPDPVHFYVVHDAWNISLCKQDLIISI